MVGRGGGCDQTNKFYGTKSSAPNKLLIQFLIGLSYSSVCYVRQLKNKCNIVDAMLGFACNLLWDVFLSLLDLLWSHIQSGFHKIWRLHVWYLTQLRNIKRTAFKGFHLIKDLKAKQKLKNPKKILGDMKVLIPFIIVILYVSDPPRSWSLTKPRTCNIIYLWHWAIAKTIHTYRTYTVHTYLYVGL